MTKRKGKLKPYGGFSRPRDRVKPKVRRCRMCNCTDENCSGCIARTGEPCHWIEQDLCSACSPDLICGALSSEAEVCYRLPGHDGYHCAVDGINGGKVEFNFDTRENKEWGS